MNDVLRLLKEGERFALICHTSPDGDTLGSAMALCLGLEKLGKEAAVFCEMPVPYLLRDLPGRERVRLSGALQPGYTAVAVDCADQERMGACAAVFEQGSLRLNIDHHITNTRYGEANLVDPQAGATGEIIWQVLKDLQVEPDAAIGMCVYTAVSTDTGNFMYSNTTSRSLQVAAETLKTGFDLAGLCAHLFRERSLSRTRMMGACATNMQLLGGSRIAVSAVTQEEMKRLEVTGEDAEGAVEFLRDIDTVEAAGFLREVEPGVYKASLRSKTFVNVSNIARQFGGGGHVHAAGCRVQGERADALRQIGGALLQALEEGADWTES